MQVPGAKSNNIYVLIDGKAPAGQFSGMVRTVVMSSPTFKNWGEFTKGRCDMADADACVLGPSRLAGHITLGTL